MSAGPSGSEELSGPWKIALGIINMLAEGTASLNVKDLAPIDGLVMISLIAAGIAAVLGMAIGFTQSKLRAGRSVLLIAVAIGAGLWYSELAARGGLLAWEQYMAMACYAMVAGVVAYILAAAERAIARASMPSAAP